MSLIIYKRSPFKSSWFYLVLLIPILQPDYFKEISYFDNIYLFAKLIVFLLVSIKYLNTKKVPRFSMLLLLLFIPMYISTYIIGEPVFYAVKKTIETVLISMVIELGLYYKGIDFIKKFFKLMYFLVLINFILLLVFPNGLIETNMDSQNYKSYFLSIKNGMISWMILASCLGLILYSYYKTKKEKILLASLLIIITITMILIKSSTGLIGWFILIMYLLFVYRKSLDKYVSMRNLFILFILLFLSVVILNIQDYFSFIFELLFNKSGSFTGRTDLWTQAIEFIKQKPILGYGIRENSIIQNNYGRGFSSHNFILELTLSGGFISLLILFFILFKLINNIKKFRQNQSVKCISICIFIFFVCTITESGLYKFQWFALFTILYNIKYIVNHPKFKEKEEI